METRLKLVLAVIILLLASLVAVRPDARSTAGAVLTGLAIGGQSSTFAFAVLVLVAIAAYVLLYRK